MYVRELLEYEQALFTNEITYIDHHSYKIGGKKLIMLLYRIPTTSKHMRSRFRVAIAYGDQILKSTEIDTWKGKSPLERYAERQRKRKGKR